MSSSRSSSAASIEHLACGACGAAVPLVAGEQGTCPHCGASYTIPETYRALRDEQAANALRPRAQELYRALGRPPPAFVRFFAFFESGWFLVVGLGGWLAIAVVLSTILQAVIGRVLDINTYDVWAKEQQAVIPFGLPLATVGIGFLLSGWARKRGIVLGGLQAALAAPPPARPGAPRVCRRCGAPLAASPEELAARCSYCGADNLLHMPPAWIARMKVHARTIGSEVDAAERLYAEARSSLRNSLIIRAVVMLVLVGVPVAVVVASAIWPSTSDFESGYSSYELYDASGPPGSLPRWQPHRGTLPPGSCNKPGGLKIKPERRHCEDGRCTVYRLVALNAGDVVAHASADLPEGTRVALDIHEQSMLDDSWRTVAVATMSDARRATTAATRTGWYRLRIEIPTATPRWWSYCAIRSR